MRETSPSARPWAAGVGRRLAPWAALFLCWTGATYWLEGRIRTLLRPGAVSDRLLYVVVANLLVGVLGAGWLVRVSRRAAPHPGPRVPAWRRLLSLCCALLLGAGLLLSQAPAASDGASAPWVLVNAFAQVLSVTVAEVAVCFWALCAAARCDERRRRLGAGAITVALGAVSFGLYHLGHSPPFDTPAMVAKLSVVGVVTGLFFVVSRDVYATIVLHNFAGTLGVVQALDGSGQLDAYRHPFAPALLLGSVALVVFTLTERRDRLELGAAFGRRQSRR